MQHYQVFKEQQLEFAFPDSMQVEKYDVQGAPKPEGWSFVDFVVRTPAKPDLFIEVKDFSHASAPEQNVAKDARKLEQGELINHAFVPKARDTYCNLHLMGEDTEKIVFVVLICIERMPHVAEHFPSFKDRLLRRLLQEREKPWKVRYVQDCIVCSLESWKKYFPDITVTRLP